MSPHAQAHPHADLIAAIAASRDAFVAAFDGISDEAVRKKPAPDRWSALEIAEHVATTQNGFLKRLREAQQSDAPPHDPQTEAAFRAGLVNRATRRQSPERARPTGRFADVGSALSVFRMASDEAIQFLEACPDLLALRGEHPIFGVMNGRSLACFLVEHPRRHLEQVHETLAEVS